MPSSTAKLQIRKRPRRVKPATARPRLGLAGRVKELEVPRGSGDSCMYQQQRGSPGALILIVQHLLKEQN
ncbi:hypothetical protein WJX72_000481 [[Myrmecia] bisecta]|uniref:Uncharacterized protein n=1 Tax=[Myrmecia] bisecta TaxID=41462 RepID=A0AAW1R3Z7_9CHLO